MEVCLYQVAFLSENQFSSFFFLVEFQFVCDAHVFHTSLNTLFVFYDNLLDCSTFHASYNWGCLRRTSAFLNECYGLTLNFNYIS